VIARDPTRVDIPAASGHFSKMFATGAGIERHPRVAVLLLMAVLWEGAARAAEPAKVEDLIRQGVALRRSGKDQAALPLFQRAHELGHTPRTAAQLGLCELALGYMVDAERDLSQALESPSDGWVAKNRGALEKSLRSAQAGIGELSISGSPSGAEVLVNGKSAGQLPLPSPVKVAQGAATVTVQADGYFSLTSQVSVKGGQRLEVNSTLAKRPSATPPPVAVNPTPGTLDVPRRDTGPEPEADNRKTLTILGWSLVGVGAGAAAAGGIMLATSGSDCTPMNGFECNTVPRSKVPAYVLLGGGLATAIAGGIVLYARPAAKVEVGLGPSIALTVSM